MYKRTPNWGPKSDHKKCWSFSYKNSWLFYDRTPSQATVDMGYLPFQVDQNKGMKWRVKTILNVTCAIMPLDIKAPWRLISWFNIVKVTYIIAKLHPWESSQTENQMDQEGQMDWMDYHLNPIEWNPPSRYRYRNTKWVEAQWKSHNMCRSVVSVTMHPPG